MKEKRRILVLNGPNLNLLGEREPEVYGSESLEEIRRYIEMKIGDEAPLMEWFQSNSEFEIIEKIQRANDENWNAIVFNLAAYSHSSIAILDALKTYKGLKIEVHLTNTYCREEFRKVKVTATGAKGIIEGFGKNSYLYAIMEANNS